VLIYIFSFLSTVDVISISETNKRFHKISQKQELLPKCLICICLVKLNIVPELKFRGFHLYHMGLEKKFSLRSQKSFFSNLFSRIKLLDITDAKPTPANKILFFGSHESGKSTFLNRITFWDNTCCPQERRQQITYLVRDFTWQSFCEIVEYVKKKNVPVTQENKLFVEIQI